MKLSVSTILLIIISFLEGGILLSFEVCSSQLLMPHLGYSIYMWASILGMTLAGLALGYKLGGVLVLKMNSYNYLVKLSFGLILNLTLLRVLFINGYIFNLDSYKATILLHTSILCFPITLILGTFSPLIISKFDKFWENAVSIIFTSSTTGGILFTILSVWYITPYWGIDNLLHFLIFLSIVILLTLILNKKSLSE